MKLDAYLATHNITHDAFAAAIGTSRAAVTRYVTGDRVPSRSVMPRIVQATSGAVTANDFMCGPVHEDDDDAPGALGPDDAEPAAEHNGRAA